MGQPRIFVSHNHNDNAYCREFVATLRRELGGDEAVWYDEHNLGWGKIRREIERELVQRQHFIAILSPSAVASDWVNDEIDAAIDLLRSGSMQTLQFVVALPCEMPLLLRNYKRVVGPDGQPYPAEEAAMRALAVIRPGWPAPASATPPSITLAPDRFPQRLADLGFTAHSSKGVEYILPPLCLVPAGPFLMGSDPKRDAIAAKENWPEDEQPQHTVILPVYEIARFPVTVAEYACFVRAGQPAPQQYKYEWGTAVDWRTQLQRLDHPAECVTWHDARSYAGWLSYVTGKSWRLPTEAEWEKAARGKYGHIYPWGNGYEQWRCNNKLDKDTTTPVGMYSPGASPYGAQDMVCNVYELTSSLDKPYPYEEADGRENANSHGLRVLRGGSGGRNAWSAHATQRSTIQPDDFSVFIGFRLVRVPS